MSLLKDFEKKLEKIFEGLFTKGFKTGIQPIEIAKNLAKHMDSHKTISVNQVYAPNQFTIFLNLEDLERIKPFQNAFIPELQQFVISHAEKEGYTLLSPPQIEMFAGADLSLGQMALEAITVSPEEPAVSGAAGAALAPPQPAAVPAPLPPPTAPPAPGAPAPQAAEEKPAATAPPEVQPLAYLVSADGKETHAIDKPAVVMGRLNTNEVVVKNSSVSRVHATIIQNQEGFTLKDLESTNGTFLNGKKVTEHLLKDGDQITLGTANLIFKLNP